MVDQTSLVEVNGPRRSITCYNTMYGVGYEARKKSWHWEEGERNVFVLDATTGYVLRPYRAEV